MPRFSPDALRTMSAQFFAAAGFSEADAAVIARLLVEANLTGHDTHGVRHLQRYLDRIRAGDINPRGEVTLLHETPTTAILDGHHTLGHVAASQALELGIAKAREKKVSAVAVRNLEHVGRVGAYPEMAAQQGLVCVCFVNAQGMGRQVTPFGGIERRIGTNPIAMGFPNPGGDPYLLDMATCTIAANKMRQAIDRDMPIADDLILDAEGNPADDPRAFTERGGMLRPLGGSMGHKGFALAMMVDLMSGVLGGSGTAASADPRLNNGTFLITIDPTAFVPPDEYEQQARELTAYIEATKTPPGAQPVMMPGKWEERNRKERLEGGIPLEDAVWASVRGALAELKIAEPQPLA